MLRYLPLLLVLAVWIYAFIDCLNTPESEVRKLPKIAWVLITLLFGQVLVGPIAWFVVGRPRRNAPYGATRPQERRWVAPDDNPEFLKSLGDARTDGHDTGDPTAAADPTSGSGEADGTSAPLSEPSEVTDDRHERAGERADSEAPTGRTDDPRAEEERPDSTEKGRRNGGPEDTPPAH